MEYQIVGKNITVTDGISNAIKKKLSKMDKYFNPKDEVSCRAVVRSYKTGAKVEITITTKNITLRSEVKDKDLYAAIDISIDKLVGQMRKLKTRMRNKNNHDGLGKSIIFDELEDIKEEGNNSEVVKTKQYTLTPMSLEEAITRMEALGHSFFLYLDNEDEKISVVYKRDEGGYGLIQAENRVEL
ncbi:MAG: ribosome-associated translation inhibitor RaiA [Firmicutes bacterium]|uniref:Ribosome hibernation promoting factor n=1 Tax=Candidatus Onthovivens merdipullorum TaxID=2840889 RepID=A0A9D9DJK9_9BACL|nr:ribosome-associated translation inhibitor RaiA [Candidatus Onthovivens merdipullorum]